LGDRNQKEHIPVVGWHFKGGKMILVTGATGHIGNVLVRQLCAENAEVRGLIMFGEDPTPLKGLNIELIEGDVLDYQSLRTALDGVDIVYHLAGMISIMPGNDPLMKLVNVQGTRNIIQAAKDAGVRRIVYTSSIHALKRVPHGMIIDEQIPFDAIYSSGMYDQSKAHASLEILKSVQQGIDAVIACPTGVIGPFDYRGSEIGKIVLDCMDKKPQLYFDGAYDFVDVRDVARGLRLMADKGSAGETYILSGVQVKVVELMNNLQEILGKHIVKIKVPIRLVKLISRIAPFYYNLTHTTPRFTPYSIETLLSNSAICRNKAETKLGFRSRPIRDSLADSVAWFNVNRQKMTANYLLPSFD
jgi:dihydroflavonol-4-reductase